MDLWRRGRDRIFVATFSPSRAELCAISSGKVGSHSDWVWGYGGCEGAWAVAAQ